MKKLMMLACVAGLAAGCGSDTAPPVTPTGPTTSNTAFTVALSSANENPPISNAEAGATGTATITFHLTKDTAGTVTAATVDFSVTLANFPAGSSVRLAHIHTGAAGVNGAVLIDTGLGSITPITLAAGTGSFSIPGVFLSADNANAILANPSGYYFNAHSALNGGGVVRGQLR